MRIHGLKKYPKHSHRDGLFNDLPDEERQRAERWFYFLCKPWGRRLPNWRRAILCGVARRLSKNPPTPAWGRYMQAKLGGLTVQKLYRMEGRHPTQVATEARKWKRLAAKRAKAEAEQRQRLGLRPPVRHRLLPLD